ncbi:MAG: hypothetical protein M3444_05800 [Acidobacteriota bacterium]|nr:hypothetical protein [Acidobacteriota bacterium]
MKATLCISASLAAASLLLTSTSVSRARARGGAARQTVTARPSKPEDDRAAARIIPVKVLFKWHGYIGPGGGGGGCDAPLGICFTRAFALARSALTREEIAAGYGIALLQVKRNRLYLAFNREAALRDGTIRVSQDETLAPEVSMSLGYERITLKAGVYKVNAAVRPFGEMWVNIVKGSETPNPPSNSVTCYLYQHTTGYGSGCGVACDDGTNYPMSCSADIFRRD